MQSQVYGLLGKTLSHSFSQKYFTKKFSDLKLFNHEYINIEVENANDIKQKLLRINNLAGFNITIPYKQDILNYVDDVTDAVNIIGAANCVQIINNKWIAHNTDVIGFENSFTPLLNPTITNALILGNGGAAKAVAYVLDKIGLPFSYAVRNNESDNKLLYNDIHENWPLKFQCIINTTPLGTYPNVTEKPNINFKESFNYKNYLVYDLIYNPTETLLLSQAKNVGCIIKNGEDMLIGQAEAAWKIWNNFL